MKIQRLLLAAGFFQMHLAMQVSSTVSDGRYSVRQIVDIARKCGVRIVVLGERDLMKWEYGLWPLRGLVKTTVEDQSLFRYGVQRYLKEIAQLQAENPDMVIIPGVESAPYYYWSGSPFNGTLAINDWHRHLMAFGFKGADDFEHLPVVGNPRSNAYDQYRGDLGPLPYQQYADYAVERGAVTFWTHPEAQNIDRTKWCSIVTRDYCSLLSRVDSYTGFFVFYEGYKQIGLPGGLWDEILQDYCAGRRKKPVWVAAGLASDKEDDFGNNLKELRTVALLDAMTRDAVIKALAAGRMYASFGARAPEFALDEFSLKDDNSTAAMGEELHRVSAPTVTIRGSFPPGPAVAFQIVLIRDGKMVNIAEETGSSFSVAYRDEAAPACKGYYRVEINAPGVQVITNPIFYTER
jgi:hypothetical protein